MFLRDQSNGKKLKLIKVSIYNWDESSTYVKKPPFFDNLPDKPEGFKKIKMQDHY